MLVGTLCKAGRSARQDAHLCTCALALLFQGLQRIIPFCYCAAQLINLVIKVLGQLSRFCEAAAPFLTLTVCYVTFFAQAFAFGLLVCNLLLQLGFFALEVACLLVKCLQTGMQIPAVFTMATALLARA